MEDIKIAYDLTIRNNKNSIIQFVYGGDGFDALRIEKQFFELLKDDNIVEKYKWKKKDLKKCILKNLLDKYADEVEYKKIDDEFQELINCRVFLRKNDYTETVYIPVNIFRIIKQSEKIYDINKNAKTDLDPIYLITEVTNLCHKLQIIYDDRMIAQELNDKCLKLLRIMIKEKLSSKIIIFQNRITKIAFDYIIKTIYTMFLKSIAQPGEMVGCISAQSIGEPCTQLCCHRDTEVKVKINGEYYEPKIGNLIDNYMELHKNKVIETDLTESGKSSYVLSIPKEWDITVPGLNYETQKMEWNRVTLMTKNPPNGKLVRIKTKSGKSVIATLSHAFVSRNELGNPYTIRGDKLRKGMVVPIMCT